MLVLIFSISACNIFEPGPNQAEVKDLKMIDVQTTSAEKFVYNLGFLGDEEQALIKEDSKHAVLSKLSRELDESATV